MRAYLLLNAYGEFEENLLFDLTTTLRSESIILTLLLNAYPCGLQPPFIHTTQHLICLQAIYFNAVDISI